MSATGQKRTSVGYSIVAPARVLSLESPNKDMKPMSELDYNKTCNEKNIGWHSSLTIKLIEMVEDLLSRNNVLLGAEARSI